MKSYDVQVHGDSDQVGQAKRPWVTPSLEMIAIESAAGGVNPNKADGTGHFSRSRS